MDRQTIEALIAENRLRKVNPGASRAEVLIGRARKDLVAAPKVAEASEEIACTAAYEAMFKATPALLAVRGLRLGTTEQRKAAVQFLQAALPAALDPVLSAYDKRRQRRNDLSYDAGLAVSRKDADEAIKQDTLPIDAIGKEVDPAIAEAKSKKKPGQGSASFPHRALRLLLTHRPGPLVDRRGYQAAYRRAIEAAGGRVTGTHGARRRSAQDYYSQQYRKAVVSGVSPANAADQAAGDTIQRLGHSRDRHELRRVYLGAA